MNDKERIAYLKLIIKLHPNTPKARNAQWMLDNMA
jgi:hypothetical protein